MRDDADRLAEETRVPPPRRTLAAFRFLVILDTIEIYMVVGSFQRLRADVRRVRGREWRGEDEARAPPSSEKERRVRAMNQSGDANERMARNRSHNVKRKKARSALCIGSPIVSSSPSPPSSAYPSPHPLPPSIHLMISGRDRRRRFLFIPTSSFIVDPGSPIVAPLPISASGPSHRCRRLASHRSPSRSPPRAPASPLNPPPTDLPFSI